MEYLTPYLTFDIEGSTNKIMYDVSLRFENVILIDRWGKLDKEWVEVLCISITRKKVNRTYFNEECMQVIIPLYTFLYH